MNERRRILLSVTSVFLMLILLMLLMGCSSLITVLKPTPEPMVALPGRVFEFRGYVSPKGLYSWVIPVGASSTYSEDGLKMTSKYENADIIQGRYEQEVQIVPHSVAETPQALLLQTFSSVGNPSALRTLELDGGKLTAAAMSYDAEPSQMCPTSRALTVAFIEAGTGYIFSIRSDARNRCDVEKLAETEGVINSIRIPAVENQ